MVGEDGYAERDMVPDDKDDTSEFVVLDDPVVSGITLSRVFARRYRNAGEAGEASADGASEFARLMLGGT